MTKKNLSLFILFAFSLFSLQMQAQAPSKEDPVLFRFGDGEVKKSEFLFVYSKNNSGSSADFSQRSLEEYLELYINFKLKVREAEEEGLDTVSMTRAELNSYRDQLSNSYLFDREVNEKLIQEAYDRMQTEVRARHLLVKLEENALPADTLEAWKRIMDFRKRILKGEDFGKLAAQHSDDPSAKENMGDIGYFSALQTVYPFENAAFNGKPGDISMPVRTKFGYHLVKVEDRRTSRGKITVGHILARFPKNATDDQKKEAKAKIDMVAQRLREGADWNEMTMQYSDDNSTSRTAGELPEFGTGRMVPEFEDAAFGLKKDGDISEPVMTDYGWHIIRRIRMAPVPTYDEMKDELKRRIERDSRSQIARQTLIERIKKDYQFTPYPANIKNVFGKFDTTLLQGIWEPDGKLGSFPLFKIGTQTFTEEDFGNFIENSQRRMRSGPVEKLVDEYLDNFIETALLDYEKNRLEDKYPEFKALMKEYRDGILLFDLTDKKVWTRAIKDSTGLKAFHEKNKQKYMWGQRLDATIYRCKGESVYKQALKLVKKNKTAEFVASKLNTPDSPNNVVISHGKYEKGQNNLIDKTEWRDGNIQTVDEGTPDIITFVKVNKVLVPEPKKLDEAKGYIVSDYQEFLEKEWIKELRGRYPVTVYPEVLKTLVR